MIMSHKELRQACDCPTYEYHVHNQITFLFDFGIYGFGIHIIQRLVRLQVTVVKVFGGN